MVLALVAQATQAADWPMWRYDASRSAVTPEQLPVELKLAWTRTNPPLKPAWAEDPRLWFDANYEPIVFGGLMIVAATHNDSVSAYDATSGDERWRFFADAPVRLAPIAHEGRIYFGADDGNFYCLEAASGRLVWRSHVALGERHILGNDRLISVWPVRGGAVVADGKLYFTVGVWPFEGTTLYTIDAATGGIVQSDQVGGGPETDDSALTDLSPQGHLAVSDGKVFIPCGRSKAACYDIAAGQLVNLNYEVKAHMDYHLTTLGPWLFHGDAIFKVPDQQLISVAAPRPVAAADRVYSGVDGQLTCYDLTQLKTIEGKDRRGNPIKRVEAAVAWKMPNKELVDGLPTSELEYYEYLVANPVVVDLIAGGRLYGHQAGTVFAVDLPAAAEAAPKRVWTTKVDGQVARLLAANGRLYVVTSEGAIHCFAADAAEPRVLASAPPTLPEPAQGELAKTATELLDAAGSRDGFCLVLGVKDGRLIDELVRQSQLRVIAITPDEAKVAELRNRWSERGLYGTRVTALAGDPLTMVLPPYLATVITSEDPAAAGIDRGATFAAEAFHSLRPYGGTACLALSDAQHAALEKSVADGKLSQAKVARHGAYTTLTREGALVGSSDWTHEYGDPGNTLFSPDQLVKAPLGLLWYGGPAGDNKLFFDRHEWGPSMAVIDGRIFINGPDKLTAVDVYTGRILWQIPVPEGRSPGRQGNFTVAGYHFVAAHDGIYLVQDKLCLRIDPATGAATGEFRLPEESDVWGRVRLWNDLLITEVFRSDEKRDGLPTQIAAIDRRSGDLRWSSKARFAYPVFAVGSGKVFCFDGFLEKYYADMRRKGLVPKAGDERYLVALDASSGDELWRVPAETIVTWMSYSEGHDTLVVSNKSGLAAYQGTTGKPLWKKDVEGQGFGGHPESVWDKVILWNDQIIDQRGPGMAYFLETGEPITQAHPLTGEQVAWEFTKTGHHCNYAIASQHLLTFRAAEAGFFDMVTGGTGRLRGFRAGCRNSLLPANGVLNAPNFASGCVCSYSLFTSLAFVHVPEAEIWTYSALKPPTGPIQRLGVNLGAPGDRNDPEGSLWLEYPSVGGSSPDVAIEMTPPNVRTFRHHASQIAGERLSWVAASGLEGIESLRIPVANAVAERPYTVRLYFAEPDDVAPGGRVFDVALQGQTVLTGFDVAAEAGGPRRMVVREFQGIQAKADLTVALTAQTGKPILCGVELVREKIDE